MTGRVCGNIIYGRRTARRRPFSEHFAVGNRISTSTPAVVSAIMRPAGSIENPSENPEPDKTLATGHPERC
jgi:hypothetical protein